MSAKICLTSEYKKKGYVFIGEKIELKTSKVIFVVCLLIVLCLLVFLIKEYHSYRLLTCSLSFILLFIKYKRDQVIRMTINEDGILIKRQGMFLWKDIKSTSLEFLNDENYSVNLMMDVNGEIIRYDVSDLNKNKDELAALIEIFKTRHSNKFNSNIIKQ